MNIMTEDHRLLVLLIKFEVSPDRRPPLVPAGAPCPMGGAGRKSAPLLDAGWAAGVERIHM